MAIGAFGNSHHRYVSEQQVKRAFKQAKSCPVTRNALAEHLMRGLFNYRISPSPTNPLLGIVHLRHCHILRKLFSQKWTIENIGQIISSHLGALTNTVLHKPYSEFAANVSFSQKALTIEELRSEMNCYSEWIDYLRELYAKNPLQSARKATQQSIALDLLKIIQASQEKRLLSSAPTPFERHDITDTSGLITTLHNAMLSFNQEGVIRCKMPPRLNWLRLLHIPDLAAACAEDGFFLPIPGLHAFEQMTDETSLELPEMMFISPDTETLACTLMDEHSAINWGIVAHEGFQTVLVRHKDNPRVFTVFCVLLEHEMVRSAGTISEPTCLKATDRICEIIDSSWQMFAEQTTALRANQWAL